MVPFLEVKNKSQTITDMMFCGDRHLQYIPPYEYMSELDWLQVGYNPTH